MSAKRLFDLFWATLGLVVLSPLFLVVAMWIKLDSAGSVFFRQTRVGRFEKPFRIYKFRTMVADAEKKGLQLTAGKDPRITPSGEFLRRTKIDELPQLINVVKGEMSLVGPRPEVPKYVEYYPDEAKKVVFSLRPGITDYAAIHFRNENDILEGSEDPEKVYLQEILPEKVSLYLKYASGRSLWIDFLLILGTLFPRLVDFSQKGITHDCA
jgi:lipopolysaccharide/colanic/teichoic acid biosynthesis glycosyltransferase